MTPPSFHRLVDDYLRVRRGLGFDLESTEWKLRDFASYAERIGHSGAVTVELAVEWAQSSRSSNPAQAVRRLAAVRQFARHRALLDPATEVPPAGLLGRPPPHIYTETEVAALLLRISVQVDRSFRRKWITDSGRSGSLSAEVDHFRRKGTAPVRGIVRARR